MTDEPARLFRLVGPAGLAMFRDAPGLEVRLTADSALMLSGEPVADLNILLVGPDRQAERIVEEALALVALRGLPLLAMFTPHVAEALAPVARGGGLAAVGEIPLMVLRHETPIRL